MNTMQERYRKFDKILSLVRDEKWSFSMACGLVKITDREAREWSRHQNKLRAAKIIHLTRQKQWFYLNDFLKECEINDQKKEIRVESFA